MVRPATTSRAWLRRASRCSAAPASRASTRALASLPRLTACSRPEPSIDTVKTWGMRGAYNHNWDPYWNSALYGAYAQVQYGNAGKALICSATQQAIGHAGYHHLQPGLQRRPDRCHHPLDPGEEPDVLGGHDSIPVSTRSLTE